MTRFPIAVAALALMLAAPWVHAEVVLENAWLRPAYAGQPNAMVYVDIRATEAMKLVGARSKVAKRAELVLVDPPDRDPAKHKVVRELPVAANEKTRLAFLGSHIRLIEIERDLEPGAMIPIELEFADAKGKRSTASTEARVRGVTTARRPETARALEQKK